MANELVGQCWLIEFPTPPMRLVMMKLCDCAEPDGTSIYPSVATIERETGLGQSTIRKCLAAFEEAGLLTVQEERFGNRYGRTTVVREIDTDKLRLICGKRRKGLPIVPSTHVLREIETGLDEAGKAKTCWAVVLRPAEATPPPAGGADDGGAPPADGDPPLHEGEGYPSTTEQPPLQEGAGAPPGERANPKKITPSFDPPPTPSGSRRRGKAGEVDDLILKIRSPEREMAIAHLIEPVVRKLRIEAPDPAFALGQFADWAAKQTTAVLDDACRRVFQERRAAAKVADLEAAVFAARKAADDAARISRSPWLFQGSVEWRLALARLAETNPTEAQFLSNQTKVHRDYLAKFGVTP